MTQAYPAEGVVFQLGYVTWDLDRAVDLFRSRYGITEFYWLDNRRRPPLPRSAPPLQSMLAYRGQMMIEILQPEREKPGIYSEALRADGGVSLHHLGYMVEHGRIGPLAAEFEAQGVEVPVLNENPQGISVLYADTRRETGLYSEYVSVCPGATTLFDRIPGR